MRLRSTTSAGLIDADPVRRFYQLFELRLRVVRGDVPDWCDLKAKRRNPGTSADLTVASLTKPNTVMFNKVTMKGSKQAVARVDEQAPSPPSSC